MKKKPAYSLLMYIVVFFALPFLISLIALTINYTAGMVSFIIAACWYAYLWRKYDRIAKEDNQEKEQEMYTPNSNAFKK